MNPSRTRLGPVLVAAALSACTASNGAGPAAPTDPTDVAAPSSGPTREPLPTASEAPGPTTSPAPSPTPTPEPVLGTFDAAGALDVAVQLAAMGTRDAGTDGDVAARAVIRAEFEAAGWIVTQEPVSLPQGGSTANVVAVLDPGHLEGRHVVVGGHHDTRGGSPGANDNGSGIGVLVALARELADEEPAVPVVLVAFGAEEYQPSDPPEHHLGSDAWARDRGERVVAAMIVDMVGNGDSTCICWFDAGPPTLADRLVAVAASEGLTGYERQARGDISDHGPFARLGLPAAFLWTFDDGVLHTPRDTADRLDVEDIRRAGDLVLAFVRGLQPSDAADLAPDVG